MPFDLENPVDIQAINDTADELRPEIRTLLMADVDETLESFTKLPGNIKDTRTIYYSKSGKIFGSYSKDLSTKEQNQMSVISKRVLKIRVGQALTSDENERYRETFMATAEEMEATDKPMLAWPEWFVRTYQGVGRENLALVPWTGVFVDEGPDPEDIADGYLKIIADEIVATNISVANKNLYVSGGAYTAANIGTKLKAQWKMFPGRRRKTGAFIYLPYDMRDLYQEWLANEYPNQKSGDDGDAEYLDGTGKKAKFMWELDMGETTQTVVMTTKSNLTWGMDGTNNNFAKVLVFWYKGNPNVTAVQMKVPIGFQIGTLDKTEFNVNDLT